MKIRSNLNKKAASLAEVLIVLGIISTALVASISIIVDSLRQTRLNEIVDTANLFMIKASEISKSANEITIVSTTFLPNQRGDVSFFTLEQSGGVSYLRQVFPDRSTLNECDDNNEFNLINSSIQILEADSPREQNNDIPEEVSPTTITYSQNTLRRICLQVQLENKGEDIYEMTSRVIYTSPDGNEENILKSIYFGTFDILTTAP